MSKDSLGERRKALEDSFFREKDKQLVNQLQQDIQREQDRLSLSQVSGVYEAAVLDAILAAGIAAETASALFLVPLIEVAWADGKVETRERDAVLQAAKDRGLGDDCAGYQLLKDWLEEPPSTDLFDAWHDFARQAAQEVDPEQFGQIRQEIFSKAQGVAESAGSFLGITSGISKAERVVLDRIKASLGAK